MSALTRTPQNTNYLQPSKFVLSFDRIPTVQYFCQEVNLPGVSMGKATLNTPVLDVYTPGNKLSYNSLDIKFTIDESVQSWKEMYNWFLSMASQDTDERNRLSLQQSNRSYGKQAYSNATLNILSALNNPIIRVHFFNVWPTDLSNIEFDTKGSADEIITATANFRFDYYNFETA